MKFLPTESVTPSITIDPSNKIKRWEKKKKYCSGAYKFKIFHRYILILNAKPRACSTLCSTNSKYPSNVLLRNATLDRPTLHLNHLNIDHGKKTGSERSGIDVKIGGQIPTDESVIAKRVCFQFACFINSCWCFIINREYILLTRNQLRINNNCNIKIRVNSNDLFLFFQNNIGLNR